MDTCGKALGAILFQGEVGKDIPVASASRTLNKSECNYSTTELECLEIIFGFISLDLIFVRKKFIILSDHRPLIWLFNIKDPLSRLARWRIVLKEYDYEVRYKPDVQNLNVDILSKMYTIQEIKTKIIYVFLKILKHKNE